MEPVRVCGCYGVVWSCVELWEQAMQWLVCAYMIHCGTISGAALCVSLTATPRAQIYTKHMGNYRRTIKVLLASADM